jgi:outer membrane protein TolC
MIFAGLLSALCVPAQAQEILSLERCKELALGNNAKVQNARLSVEAAEQAKKEAFTKYFPSVSATGVGFQANKPMMSMEMDMSSMISPMMQAFEPTMMWLVQQGALDPAVLQGLSQPSEPTEIEALKNGLVGGVMAMQPIFAGGQIVNGNRLAKAGVEVRELQKQMTGQDVLLAVENYFWQLVSMKEKMKTIAEAETMLNRIHSDVEAAVEAGLANRNDLLRVELEQHRLASARLKLENGLRMLKMAFAQHIGIASDSFDIATTPVLDDLAAPFVDTQHFESALLQRPEYRLLEKSVDVAALQTRMEIGKNMPTVAVGAGYNYIDFDRGKPAGMKNNFGMVFATVSVPLSGWWGGSHAIRKRKLELRVAENTRRENADLLLLQMRRAADEMNEAYQQTLIAKKSITIAEENVRMSEDHYRAGISILSDLLDAQNLLQQANDRHTEALTDYRMKLAQYRRATGD